MFLQMGRKPSEEHIRQIMKSVKTQTVNNDKVSHDTFFFSRLFA